jgi:hypothetical protein
LEHAELTYSEYRRLTVEQGGGLMAISYSDSENLRAFLNGTIDDCKQIDWSLAQSVVPVDVPKPAKTNREDKPKTKHDG